MESRICQNCKNSFNIEPDDFSFYEKIDVPAPLSCPNCRLVRRMTNSNERVLYRRKCDLSGESILSMFPEDSSFPVYKSEVWYSDDWDPYDYGSSYNFSKPFFVQFQELLNKVPRMALVKQGLSKNSEYTHRAHDMKDSYMVFRMSGSKDSSYCYVGRNITNCVDCFSIWDSELCYECIDCNNCYKVRFSQESHDCRDSFFLYACRNCSDCVGCINLFNQSYCIFNIKYTKEEYEEKLKDLNLDSFSGINNFKNQFEEFRKKFPYRSTHSLKSSDYSGNWIVNCQNVKDSFGCLNVKDGKYLMWIFNAQDCMDYFQWGNSAELVYDSENVGINVSRIKFSSQCWMGAHDLEYCDSCPGAGNCFGCIGLKKGEYSILNKKYSKEEYEEMIPKIKQHMIDMPYIGVNGRIYPYGENFPFEISPFAYNESAAIDFFPISKEEALEKGYKWKDREKTQYTISKNFSDLPETIVEVSDSIKNEIISCSLSDNDHSPGAFNITDQELNFYRQMNIPLPRASFPIRHLNRLKQRPPIKLIDRTCNKCGVDVKTVYTEDFAPILYCESCYQQEVV